MKACSASPWVTFEDSYADMAVISVCPWVEMSSGASYSTILGYQAIFGYYIISPECNWFPVALAGLAQEEKG